MYTQEQTKSVIMQILIRTTIPADVVYASMICEWYVISSKERGTGIALRTKAYVSEKMTTGHAIIALQGNKLLGFCYVETFEDSKYVSNSGLIVGKTSRGMGLAVKIKDAAVNLARKLYPRAKLFGITTSDRVMKINSDLGYIPVSFSKLTTDIKFWNSCGSCRNYDILIRNNRKMCLCTAMLAPSGNDMKVNLTNLIVSEVKK